MRLGVKEVVKFVKMTQLMNVQTLVIQVGLGSNCDRLYMLDTV